MKKSLFVFAVLVVACSFASASNWTFGFESTGHGLYCNFEQINNNSFSAAATNPQGFPVKGVIYGDSLYQALGFGSYYEWGVASNLKCSERKFGWVGVADYVSNVGFSTNGFIFGDNYGFLSCNIPGKNVKHNGMTSTGKAAKN